MFGRDDVQYVVIASRGSSSNVARYAQYLLGRAHRVPVMFATPSLYTIYEQPPRLAGAAVIGISQSGASPDVVVGARRGAQARAPDRRAHECRGLAARARSGRGASARGRRRARGCRDEDVHQLARRDRAPLRGDRRPGGRGRARADAGCAPAADRALARDGACARRVRGRGRSDGRRARRELRNRVRDRAEDPRALRARRRGVLAGRPDARADRGDPSRAGP